QLRQQRRCIPGCRLLLHGQRPGTAAGHPAVGLGVPGGGARGLPVDFQRPVTGGGGHFTLAAPNQYRQCMIATTLADTTLDRKSTRLNSSHVKISYAVFCLKKK